jgi:hypothetical protein
MTTGRLSDCFLRDFKGFKDFKDLRFNQLGDGMAVSELRLAVNDTWDLLERYGHYHRDTRLVKGYPTGHTDGREVMIDEDSEKAVTAALKWMERGKPKVHRAVFLYFIGKRVVISPDNAPGFYYYQQKSYPGIAGILHCSDRWAKELVYNGVSMLEGRLSRD